MSALRVAFSVAEPSAEAKELSTVGEELLLPATEENLKSMVCCEFLGEAAAQETCAPFWGGTITRWIEAAKEIEGQLLVNESSRYAAVDVSTTTEEWGE